MTQSNSQSKREPSPSEKRSREHFDRWLRAHCVDPSISWDYEPYGAQTAPDYLLTLDGREFAVEVTAVMHSKRVGNTILSLEDIWFRQRDLVRAAEKKCRSGGVLTGIYYIDFVNAVPNLSKQRNRVIEEVFKYVAETQADYQADKQAIVFNEVQVCTIIKTSNQANAVCLSNSIDHEASTGSVPLCELLREKVEGKARLLELITLPRILLLDEQSCIEQPHVWYDCLDNYPSTMAFHTIFVVRDSGYDFAIQVGDARWPVLHPGSDMPAY